MGLITVNIRCISSAIHYRSLAATTKLLDVEPVRDSMSSQAKAQVHLRKRVCSHFKACHVGLRVGKSESNVCKLHSKEA